jgi:hypothetical protein
MTSPIEVHLVQFQTQGFLHLPGVIQGATLSRLQQAFDRAAGKYADQWNAPGSPQVFDIPRVLDEDDVFVDLVDLPTLFPTLLAIIGGDIQLLQTQARLMRPGPSHTPPWHSDMTGLQGVNLSQTLNFHVKVHFYPHDLTPDQGCLAFLPGSHRYADGPDKPSLSPHLDSGFARKVVPSAGDAVVFNTHLMHMALANESTAIRKSLIYSYSHFWVKPSVSGAPNDLARLATTPQRRQLFGQPTSSEVPPFFQTLLPPEGSPIKSMVTAGGQLLRRTLGLPPG